MIETGMPKKFSLSVIIRLGVSIAAIGLIVFFFRDKMDDALELLRGGVYWPMIGLAILLYFLCQIFMALRFHTILKGQSIHLRYSESLYLTFLGLFFNLFLPSAVGGDIAKGYYLYRYDNRKIAATTSVLQDRLIGFAGLMLMAAIAVFFNARDMGDQRILPLVMTFMMIVTGCIIFFFNKTFARNFKWTLKLVPSQKIQGICHELYHAIHEYKNHKMILLWSVLYSFCGQCMFILMYYFAARSLAVNASVWYYFFLVPTVAIISMIPSIGGLGVREAGIVVFFQKLMPAETALALSLLLVMLVYSFSVAGGILYAMHGGLKNGMKLTE